MSEGFNHWEALALALQEGAERAVDNTAEIAVGNVQQQIEANDQVRSGEMRDSAYAKSQRFSTYKSSEHALDEIPAPNDALEADVAMAAAHSIFPEMGTVYQSPKPYFTPGMEKTRHDFDAQIEYYVVQALEDAARP
jgi:hypothetical protein